MKQFHHRIVGLRTDLVDSSSFTASKSKSENEDSFFGDFTVDLSFLSSDDSLSNLSRDVVDTTKERELFVEKVLSDECSNVVLSEKQSTKSDLDDSEDTPCWIGLLSHSNLASGAKSVTSRRSIDDLSGFYRLNPLAPRFIPSSSKKNIDTDNGKRDDEVGNSSSLKKSLSSDFPSSSGEFNIADRIEDSVSKTVSVSDTRNELQTSKKLDPLAPVFVPGSAKLSPLVHEKQGAFDTTSALPSPDSSKLVEVNRSVKIRYPDSVNESGSTSSYNPWFESKVGSSSNNSRGQRRLNPLAPQFSLTGTKPKAYGYEKNQVVNDLSVVVNTVGLSPPIGYGDHNVVDADLPHSSVYAEHLVPNTSLNRFGVEPNATLSVKDSMDFELPLPFHVVETATSNDVQAFSGYGQRHNSFSASSSSPKLDVKKLLTTMHGLSELLTHAHVSESSDLQNPHELDLVNSTVQNLSSYIENNIQGQAGTAYIGHKSYDLNLSPNKSKLSTRNLPLPRVTNMTVGLDVKRKEKYPMVSGGMVPNSCLSEYVEAKDNNFGQVVATNGYQQDRQGEGQIHPHALFYKSLWLKAEADRCLMVYETSLSNPTS